MSHYPDIQTLTSQTKDVKILEVKRSFRSILSSLMLFFFSIIALVVLNYFFYDLQPPQNIPFIRHLSVRWLAIVPIGILVEIIRRYHDDLYVFERHRVTHLEGRLSLNYFVPAVKYIDIRGITVDQDIWGRIFDYGTISLGTAGQEGEELILTGVRDPRGLAMLIDQLRNYSKRMYDNGPSGEGVSQAQYEVINFD